MESRQEETNQGNGHKKEVPRKSVKTRTQECSTFFFINYRNYDHITRDKEQTCLKVACQLFTKTGEQNSNNKRKEIERFDWFI